MVCLGTWPNTAEIEKRLEEGDAGGVKRAGRPVSPQPASHNKYSILYG